jgi:hypothetical protein
MSEVGIRHRLLPRLVRLRDAPFYLGMDRNRFNSEVRPYLTEIPIGEQGIAFDRLELDRWVDEYVAGNGRPGDRPKGARIWDAREQPDSANAEISGISRSKSKDMACFEKAVKRAIMR